MMDKVDINTEYQSKIEKHLDDIDHNLYRMAITCELNGIQSELAEIKESARELADTARFWHNEWQLELAHSRHAEEEIEKLIKAVGNDKS